MSVNISFTSINPLNFPRFSLSEPLAIQHQVLAFFVVTAEAVNVIHRRLRS